MVELTILPMLIQQAVLAPVAAQAEGETGAEPPFAALLATGTPGGTGEEKPVSSDDQTDGPDAPPAMPDGTVLPPVLQDIAAVQPASPVPPMVPPADGPHTQAEERAGRRAPLARCAPMVTAQTRAAPQNQSADPQIKPAAPTPMPVPHRAALAINLVDGPAARPLSITKAALPVADQPADQPRDERAPAPSLPTARDFAAPQMVQPDAPPLAMAHPAPRAVVEASPPAPDITQRHDIAVLVDRLVEARDVAMASQTPQVVHASLRHMEFGAVDLRIAAAADRIDVSLTSPDPEFARTVQSAAPAALVANTDGGSGNPAQGHSAASAGGQSADGHASRGQTPGGHTSRQHTARETADHRRRGDEAPSAQPRRQGILA